MTTRRHVLHLLAAAPVLASCGGGGPDPAAAWRDPGAGETDPRRFALAHAILAPNPHNTQPWLIELDDTDGLTLFCDLNRRLPFTDPNDRQITIGCGAFLELFRIAAAQLGFQTLITPFPEGASTPRLDHRPIAHVRLVQAEAPLQEPRMAYITQRRTNRNVYDPARLPDDTQLLRIASGLGAYMGAVQWTLEPTRVAALRDLVWRAFDREMRTRGAQEETYGWLRFSRAEIAEHRDGLAIEGPMVPLVRALGMLSLDDFLDPDSMANKQAADDWRAKAESAPAFLWMTTADDSALARLNTGRAYARLNIDMTAYGLAIHPWSQALQEYAEMADLYTEAKTALGADDGVVQMLVRVGFGEPAGPSARRGVDALIRTH